MNALVIMVVSIVGYLIAYNTYGKWLSAKIFNINSANSVPSKTKEDGVDYVPTEKGVVFGHHFTSIAGTGPIVGPAIGVIWGWVPAVLWIFFGSIFMGAVHDFATLIVSLRNEGRSIVDISAKYINKRVRLLFFLIVFLALLIVIAIFGLVIAIIFARFPQSVVPVWAEIPIAMSLGYIVLKKRRITKKITLLAKIAFLFTFFLGSVFPYEMPSLFGIPATGVWTIILLIYAYIASVLPVTVLLQPRDYLNAWQLYFVLALISVGILFTGVSTSFEIAAPAFQYAPEGAPNIWPFLFITIACGAISGFHSLVSSGTTSKQVKSEKDAKFIGYGAMLVEATLATIVIVAVTAGIGMGYMTDSGDTLYGIVAWKTHYASWAASSGLGSKLDAVIIGSSNILNKIGIPLKAGIIIMGVFIASFAGTTLDTATRIQRYIIAELCETTKFNLGANKWIATAIAVLSGAGLAFSAGANGKGALILWPLFGSVNQLLGALALLVVTAYLKKNKGFGFLVTMIPCIFLLSMTLWAVLENQMDFINQGKIQLIIINMIILVLTMWMIVEAGVSIFYKKNKERGLK